MYIRIFEYTHVYSNIPIFDIFPAASFEYAEYLNLAATDPSAHPQHMNDLKHLVYVWSGCGNHIMWICRINCIHLTRSCWGGV